MCIRHIETHPCLFPQKINPKRDKLPDSGASDTTLTERRVAAHGALEVARRRRMEDALPRRVRVRHVAEDNTQWRGLKRSLGLGFQHEDTKSVFLISVCYIMLMI